MNTYPHEFLPHPDMNTYRHPPNELPPPVKHTERVRHIISPRLAVPRPSQLQSKYPWVVPS